MFVINMVHIRLNF